MKYVKLHKCRLDQDDLLFPSSESGDRRGAMCDKEKIQKVTARFAGAMQRVIVGRDQWQRKKQPANGIGNGGLLVVNSPYSEICEGVYVGGWPYSADKLPPGNPAIIDCTCEFPRKEEFKGHSYLCLPTWDTRAPQPGEIESAVKWACRKRAQNRPVFIHCAYGHGRSVAVMSALLVALGVVEDWKKAEQFIRERRPCISMNSVHYNALEEWSKHRLSTPKRNKVNTSSATPASASGHLRNERRKNRSD
ncbi:hypothetical protein OIU77_013173 [Salix suchowensis]|uniref:Tyrosine specific protein phosphatases domain-containing protein n=1 Tax=Salix suchowensis TaxID=1278906 RepID=A0ABQ8ZT71_9ROSI|nr:hypothetical protein OIU77_013173 [Salix suchowensis]